MNQAGFLPRASRLDKHSFLLEAVRDKKALDLGCCGGLLEDVAVRQFAVDLDVNTNLHFQMCDVAADLTGVDLSAEKLRAMETAGVSSRLIAADVSDEQFTEALDGEYEVVVLGDLIEHLDNVRQTLRNCSAALADDGVIVISTPNAFYVGALLKLLANYESVHPEHTCYFSYRTMERVLEKSGLRITGFWYGRRRRKSFSNRVDKVIHGFSELLCRLFPQFSESILFYAKKAT